MKELYYLYYRWRYNIPHHDEIDEIVRNLYEKPCSKWFDMVVAYTVKQPLDRLAKMYDVTPERLRVIIWHFWKMYK